MPPGAPMRCSPWSAADYSRDDTGTSRDDSPTVGRRNPVKRASRDDSPTVGRRNPVKRASRDDSPTVGRRNPVKADRKSTRLNSSHQIIPYSVFCFKEKKALSVTL